MNIVSLYPCPFAPADRHDISAAVSKGGELYAYEEDKFTSVKQEPTSKFPERSLFFGLRELGLEIRDIDLWVFPEPGQLVPLENLYVFFTSIVKAYTGNQPDFDTWERPCQVPYGKVDPESKPDFVSWLETHVVYVPHAISHVAMAVYTSEFADCAFLSMDGGGDPGDDRNMIFGQFQDNNFNFF